MRGDGVAGHLSGRQDQPDCRRRGDGDGYEDAQGQEPRGEGCGVYLLRGVFIHARRREAHAGGCGRERV